jgi:hypothetical protein
VCASSAKERKEPVRGAWLHEHGQDIRREVLLARVSTHWDGYAKEGIMCDVWKGDSQVRQGRHALLLATVRGQGKGRAWNGAENANMSVLQGGLRREALQQADHVLFVQMLQRRETRRGDEDVRPMRHQVSRLDRGS